MKKKKIILVFFLLSAVGFGQKPTTTPWDTIVAKIHHTEALSQPDSIKHQLIKNIFDKNQIALADYEQFYARFTMIPLDSQKVFVEKVKQILDQKNKEIGIITKPSKIKSNFLPNKKTK